MTDYVGDYVSDVFSHPHSNQVSSAILNSSVPQHIPIPPPDIENSLKRKVMDDQDDSNKDRKQDVPTLLQISDSSPQSQHPFHISDPSIPTQALLPLSEQQPQKRRVTKAEWNEGQQICLLEGYNKYYTDPNKWNLIKKEYCLPFTTVQLKERVRLSTSIVILDNSFRMLTKPNFNTPFLNNYNTILHEKNRRVKVPWNEEETQQLLLAVERYKNEGGPYKWKQMRDDPDFHFLHLRTPMDLKDKWRNVQERGAPISRTQRRDKKMFELLDFQLDPGTGYPRVLYIFKNRTPRAAACRAATRNFNTIFLHEVGTDIIHCFRADHVQIPSQKDEGFREKITIHKIGTQIYAKPDFTNQLCSHVQEIAEKEARIKAGMGIPNMDQGQVP